MKFGDNERKAFKKELQAAVASLETKYGIKVSYMVRESEPNYLGLKFKEVEKPAPAVKPEPVKAAPKAEPVKPAAKPEAPAKKASSLDEMDIDDINLDDLDFSDLGANEPKAEPVKPAAKPEAPAKKASSLDEMDIDDINLDDLDFSDLGPEEETTKTAEASIDDLQDDDYDDEPVPAPKKKKSTVDDEDRYSQELQKYLGGTFDGGSGEPENIFEELSGKGSSSYDDDISEDEIDAYLAASGRFSFSFQAKLIQAEGSVQDYYTDIKNLLLSYEGVKSKVSWDNDTFTCRNKEIAKIDIDKDKLHLYLKLNPADYEGSYEIMSEAKDPKYSSTKAKLVVSSFSDIDSVYELIEDLTNDNHIYPGEDRYDDYHFEYETNDELIARGLIKRQ